MFYGNSIMFTWSSDMKVSMTAFDTSAFVIPGPQTERRPEKGGKLNTSQAGSVAASRAAVGQFLSISREVFILRTR